MQTDQAEQDHKNRKWVTSKEVDLLRMAARQTRQPLRNELLILMLYRHGLRETELCNLRLDFLDLDHAKIHIKRIKGGMDFTHPIAGDELRLIRSYLRQRKTEGTIDIPWIFLSERRNQLSRFSVIKIVESCYKLKSMRKITPHMLRHGCGYYLANKGYDVRLIQDYLGHKNIQNTVIYTRLSGKQFEGLWN